MGSLLLLTAPAFAQGSAADYQRSAALRERFAGKLTHDRVEAVWLQNGDLLYTVNSGVGKNEIFWVDVDEPEGKQPRILFDSVRLAEAVQRDAGVVGLAQAEDDKVQMLLSDGDVWQIDLATQVLAQRGLDQPSAFELEPERDRSARSTRGRGGTSLVVFNQSQEEITLYWVEPDGGKRAYGKLPAGGTRVMPTYAGHLWRFESTSSNNFALFRATSQSGIARLTDERLQPRPSLPATNSGGGGTVSSNQQPRVERREGQLFWLEPEEGRETKLTTDGSAADTYSRRLRWAPTGGAFATFQNRHTDFQRQVTIVESAPRDQEQPRTIEFDYTKPGDPLDFNRPKVFLVDDQMNATPIVIDDAEFGTPWRINQTTWTSDGTRFRFLNNARGHQRLAYQEIDIRTGKLRTLIDERSDTFINYSNKTYLSVAPDGKRAVWMSERSGWNHLYLYDLDKGEVVRPLTEGEWVVRSVESLDWSTGQALLRVQGQHSDQDPYHVHYARLDLVTRELTALTEGDGTHSIEWSDDGEHYLDRYSRVDLPTVTELRRSKDGSLVYEVSAGNWDQLTEAGWRPQQRFVAHGRDGETEIWGIVTRPTNFDPNKQYPIVEYIYAGPHDQHVPKSFRVHSKMREFAELGFIVVQIDGMGTNWRSKAFHDVAWKNLADAGFPDRRLWIEAFAATEPAADLSRIGIFGGSAGGQNAMRALIDHNDFYKVAVADCGCHDNRMDKIWWNEAWMGWPIDDSYARSSNVDHAHRVQGSLFLIVGELDQNVDPASTMQVVDALVRANKDFDLLVIPGAGHGAAETPYGTRRRRDFLVRELMNVEPRWQ